MKRIGNGAVWILYSVLFCLVSLGLALVPSPQITMAQAASVCAELNGLEIPAISIGLPTTGGLVTTATSVSPNGLPGAKAIGEYCKVLGEIYPVDPTAPNIKFQVDLPTSWNHKRNSIGNGYVLENRSNRFEIRRNIIHTAGRICRVSFKIGKIKTALLIEHHIINQEVETNCGFM